MHPLPPSLCVCRIRRVPIGVQALSIQHCEGERVAHLLPRPAQQHGGDGGGGNLHVKDVVQPDIRTIHLVGGQASLDLVRRAQGTGHVVHRQRIAAFQKSPSPFGPVLRSRKDRADIVGGMAAQHAGIAEIHPADQHGHVEGGLHGIGHERRSENARCPFDGLSEQVAQQQRLLLGRSDRAGQGIRQTQARRAA
jgi:hypothetical protein